MTRRIQRQRTKGWRMPEDAVYVGRPTIWGNPFPVTGDWITWTAVAIGYRGDAAGCRHAAVALFRAWMTGVPITPSPAEPSAGALVYASGRTVPINEVARSFAIHATRLYTPTRPLPPRPDLTPLAGRDLACWCPEDVPCHADILLDLANEGAP